MEPVKSYEQYRALTQKARSIKNLSSNWYQLPQKAREEIETGKLFFEERPGGFLFLTEEPEFFRCYFFLDGEKTAEPLKLKKPAAAELVFQNNMTSPQETQARLLTEMGFTLGRESGRMACSALEAVSYECGLVAVHPTGVGGGVEPICGLIRSAFDPRYAYLSTEEETRRDLEAGRIFTIWEENSLLGVLYSEEGKGAASIRQLVVKEGCRGRGLGGQLISCYHNTYRQRVRSFYHWVDLKNTAAIRFYQKFGYSPDGRRANEYLLS